ncbi:hypothetical protein BB455_07385 [Helicobacter pylori]|nr:hypothetical protein BB455_07385 [Helicobacter pylori]
MFSPFLLFGLNWISIRDFIHWNAFALECICIGMYLGYYSIKRFFFFVIWGKFCHFFDSSAFCLVLA